MISLRVRTSGRGCAPRRLADVGWMQKASRYLPSLCAEALVPGEVAGADARAGRADTTAFGSVACKGWIGARRYGSGPVRTLEAQGRGSQVSG